MNLPIVVGWNIFEYKKHLRLFSTDFIQKKKTIFFANLIYMFNSQENIFVFSNFLYINVVLRRKFFKINDAILA